MSLFPNSFFASPSAANNTSFHPLFRLLDDFEQHSRNNTDEGHQPHRQLRTNMKSFTPKFDVKELPEAYELHGDLPGIEQKDVEIEFTDVQTITVRGRTERSYTAGTPPSGFIEGSSAPAAIEGATSDSSSNKPAAHKATVEDEDAVMVTDPAQSNTNTSSEVATTTKNANNKEEKSEPKAKYWVSERSVGEFSRSFTFPVRVDQDGVKASMKNGVLSITVPKAKKREAKKIPIWSM
ncbi:HSP20-like chaperone [Rhexocercosporidium sp. MPI-PUGE-AT-0058]|nr:HSP20-like chaperone [Rhexocercosporidium sp. MPI-PUGE-AT-0058]